MDGTNDDPRPARRPDEPDELLPADPGADTPELSDETGADAPELPDETGADAPELPDETGADAPEAGAPVAEAAVPATDGQDDLDEAPVPATDVTDDLDGAPVPDELSDDLATVEPTDALWPSDASDDVPAVPTGDAPTEPDVQPELAALHELTAETRAIAIVDVSPPVVGHEAVPDATADDAPDDDAPDVALEPAPDHAPAVAPDALQDTLPDPDVAPQPVQAVVHDELDDGAEPDEVPDEDADASPHLSSQPMPSPPAEPVLFTDRDPLPEPGPAEHDDTVADDATPATTAGTGGGTTAAGAAPEDEQPVPETNGWLVLGRALRPRLTRAQVLTAVLCAVLGFALVVQVRQTGGASLEGMRQADLVRILDETTTRGDALAREAADLQRERDGLVSGSDTRQAAIDAAERSAATQGILTGRLPAEGPGVTVTLTEVDGAIKPSTLLNILEEMRNAGAEAIELNGQRITASSAFTGRPGAIDVDGVTIHAPYVWIAIGDPDTVGPALSIPGGALAQVRGDGGVGTVDAQQLVQVTAVRAVPDPVYATPVAPSTD